MTARRYFDVLVDTFLIHRLDPFTKSAHRRLVQHPRYYLFDVGVLNGALGNFQVSPDRLGRLFERLVLQLVLSELSCRDLDHRLSVYRTESGAEVDFGLEMGGKVHAIEVKASKSIGWPDLRGLQSFMEFHGRGVEPIMIYRGERRLTVDGIDVLPLEAGLAALGLA